MAEISAEWGICPLERELVLSMTETNNSLVINEEAQNILFREARTANAFTNEPVSDEQIKDIFELVKWAPTSMNIQPLRVLIIRSEEAKQRMLPYLAEGNAKKVHTFIADHSPQFYSWADRAPQAERASGYLEAYQRWG